MCNIKNNNYLSISKRILSLAIPMSGTTLLNVGSNFLCMAMLAHLGHEVLAASALIFSTQLSIIVSGTSFLFSLSVLIGHAYGAKEYRMIGNFLQLGWTFGLLISVPIIILFLNIDKVLTFLGESPTITQITHTYFHAFAWAVVPTFLSSCNMQFGYGIHRKSLIVSISVISMGVLLLAAYLLIFGKLGLPEFGVTGLGYAIAAQNTSFFILTTLFFYFEKNFKRFELFKYRVHHHLEHFAQMFKIGWPICVQMGGEMLSFFISGIMIGWLGTTSLAAIQIVNQYYFLTIIPIFSLSQASGILVGHARGAKQIGEVKKISQASMVIAMLLSIVVAILFLLFPVHLASFYMNTTTAENATTLHLTIIIFTIIAFSQLFDSFRNISLGILRGMFDTRFPMYVSILTIWMIGMPLSYMLAFPLHFNAPGFVLGGAVTMFLGAIIMGFRLRRTLVS